jgi:hypothetical protein
MNGNDLDWEGWASAWRSGEVPVETEALRRRLAAQRRRLLAVALGEAVLVCGFGALSWLVARDGIAAWEAVWLGTVWAFTLVAVVFAVWNRRGTWRSLGESVEEYVRLARLRAQRGRLAAAFAGALVVAETIAVIVQLAWFGRLTPVVIAVLAGMGAAVAIGCAVVRRRLRRELERLAVHGPAADGD